MKNRFLKYIAYQQIYQAADHFWEHFHKPSVKKNRNLN